MEATHVRCQAVPAARDFLPSLPALAARHLCRVVRRVGHRPVASEGLLPGARLYARLCHLPLLEPPPISLEQRQLLHDLRLHVLARRRRTLHECGGPPTSAGCADWAAGSAPMTSA